MSSQNIVAFFEKVESDEGLKARLKKLGDESESAAVAEVIKIAEGAGFQFTAEELVAFRAGRREAFRISPSFEGLRMMRSREDCCYWSQSCMPGFSGGGGGGW